MLLSLVAPPSPMAVWLDCAISEGPHFPHFHFNSDKIADCFASITPVFYIEKKYLCAEVPVKCNIEALPKSRLVMVTLGTEFYSLSTVIEK